MGRDPDGQAWEKKLRAIGLAVMVLEAAASGSGTQAGELWEIRFKLDADGGTSVLAILKAREGSRGSVSFVGGLDLSTTVLAAAKKMTGGALKWREDRPWGT